MPLEFRCADVGAACGKRVTADTKDELLAKVGEHARSDHGVELNDTLIAYALSEVRQDTGS
jgi:predicted small metal-binding protein